MNLENFIFLAGVFNIVLVIFHTLFWKVFNWKVTLDKGTKANKAATQIMNIQLIYLFLFMTYVYLFNANYLTTTSLGRTVLIGYAGFWLIRFFQQFIFLKQKGKFVIGLTILFFIGAVLHLIPVII